MLIAQKGIPGAPLWFVFFQGAVPRLRAVPSTNFIPLEPCFFCRAFFQIPEVFFGPRFFGFGLNRRLGILFEGIVEAKGEETGGYLSNEKKGPWLVRLYRG